MLSENNGVTLTTQCQSKREKTWTKKNTYHVVTRRLAFAFLVIRLALGLQRKPPFVSKIEISATRWTSEKERRRKEVLPFSLSLQILWKSFAYYEYAQRVLKGAGIQNQRSLKNHGLKQSQEPGKKKTLPWSSSRSLKPKVARHPSLPGIPEVFEISQFFFFSS